MTHSIFLEERKSRERDYHNFIRGTEVQRDPPTKKHYTSNAKYYSVHGLQVQAVEQWWSENLPGRTVLDYCCGNGKFSIDMAHHQPGRIVGIDISDVSVTNSRSLVEQNGLSHLCEFHVMDAEETGFADNTFDVVNERGVLHHLDLERAYAEIARILKPEGAAICQEAVRHNPIIQLYRRMTPHLRTACEVDHILGKKEIRLAAKYFHRVEIIGFFHLTTLLAVPFRKTRIFQPMLRALEKIDTFLLGLPGIKWQAWSVVFVLSNPIKREGSQP